MSQCPNLLLKFLLFPLIVFGISCNNSEELKTTKLRTSDVSDKVIDSINSMMEKDTSNLVIKTYGSRGGLWNSFKEMYINCLKSGDNPPDRKLIYLGTSSSKTIGTIYAKNAKDLINSFYKCFLVEGEIDSAKANKEFKKFAEFNNTTSCDLTQKKNLALSYLLQGAIQNVGDLNLSGQIKKSDSIILKATSWQKIQIYDSLFVRYLDTTTNASIIQFKKDAINSGNIILVTVYKISGFSGDIYKTTGFGADLTAKLKNQGETLPLEGNPTDTTSNEKLKFHLNVDSDKNTVIHVRSTGDFYVFAFYKKFETND